jgi:oligopeptidase B
MLEALRPLRWLAACPALALLAGCGTAQPSPPQPAPPAPPAVEAAPAPRPEPRLERAADGTPLPPIARADRTSTEAAGRTIADDYRWLRERENPEVLAYLEAENLYTEAVMAHTAAMQEALYQEMKGRIRETDLSVPYELDGYFYYRRTEAGGQYPIFCRKAGSLEAPEQVILDVNALAAGHDYFQVGLFAVSPDARLLAYGYDTDGSENYTLRIKDLATGALLADEVRGLSYGLEWGNDNRTLFYVTQDAAVRPYKVFRHLAGGDPAADELVYHEADEAFYVSLDKTSDRRYLLVQLGSSTTSEVQLLDADRPGGDFRLFAARRPGIEYYVEHHGEHFYLRTNDGARNFRLVRTAEAATSPENWRDVIPASEDVTLNHFLVFARHLAVFERRGGLQRIRIRQLETGEEHAVDFPEAAYAVRTGANPSFDTALLRFQYSSMVTPPSVFDYHMDERTRQLRKQTEVPGGYDPSRYTTERATARAADGTAIPISLVYRKGLVKDGRSPCLLTGYGAYGASSDPHFSAANLSLLDRGFVYAIAHVRGGGEMGQRWHDAGKLLAKKNTFTDFVAAAEHLVREGYTSPARLAIWGGSAGGLLIGAVLNLRPDLFGAAIAEVPFVDVINSMLDPSIPLVVIEYEEWGNPNDPRYFDYMLSYSPYDNVRSADYPHLLITAGWNDPRVGYWEPAKWTAKLRATSHGSRRLLLKTHMGAGHGGASGRYDELRELAFQFAFLLDALGVPGG